MPRLSALDLAGAKGGAGATSGPNIDALYENMPRSCSKGKADLGEIFSNAVMKIQAAQEEGDGGIISSITRMSADGGSHTYLGVSWEAVKADLEGGGGKLVENYSYWEGGTDKAVLSAADIVHDTRARWRRGASGASNDEGQDALGAEVVRDERGRKTGVSCGQVAKQRACCRRIWKKRNIKNAFLSIQSFSKVRSCFTEFLRNISGLL